MRLNLVKQLWIVGMLVGCAAQATQNIQQQPVLDNTAMWSVRMAESEMRRFPQAWMIDWREQPRWDYTHGLELLAFSRLYKKTKDEKYLHYIKNYYDELIDAAGNIDTYKQDKYNIDMINAGKLLFFLYDVSGDDRYIKAALTLGEQLEKQPRTSEGGFWHKKIYPEQMWLDGLYMGSPFYAEYIMRLGQPQQLDDVLLQFELIEKHLYDQATGLPRHGWDESRQQRWADKSTGLSPHHWSRSIGWYIMAMVDVLDIMPALHPKYPWLSSRLENLVNQVAKYQDPTGTWYQVTDLGSREGNYLEASGTAMITYAIARAVNQHHLPLKYLPVAKQGFAGMLDQFISVDAASNLISLNQNCAVAGLGGNPYRDGSFEYYINEPIRANDPKGVGPFILAALELGQ